ncbi:hypothetical protein HS088_TW19G00855 [Tripterygium wilfordii]|uniref:F-box domain-containing protein n=1 Tax=Tripterygium wilfordii TaxID=458696 RepID=A0A7J7CAV6_TRIWF|nr:F-box/kelch-repeat protein At3g23880-like [Tripterygium wilfordii]KAF5731249.1 hypothetical protein HS088_TW19G00855 [Tripterygium wilfordii]
MAANSSASSMPETIIKDILSRLPVKSLVRFKSLSKPICSLIHSHDFMAAHLCLSSLKPTLLVRRYHNPTGCNFQLTLVRESLVNDLDIPNDVVSALRCFPKIVGSCNGVVCLDISKCHAADLFLWNLATREVKRLPKPTIKSSPLPWMVTLGFGYDHKNHEFNIVRLVTLDDDTKAEVYKTGTGTWDQIEDLSITSCAVSGGQQAVSVNGELHWLALGGGLFNLRRYIVSFNMGDNKFRQIPAPDLPVDCCLKLMFYKKSLTLAAYPLDIPDRFVRNRKAFEEFDLWVLGEEDGSSWSKHVMIDSLVRFIFPIGVWGDDKIMMKRIGGNRSRLILFDPMVGDRAETLQELGGEDSLDVFTYVESLMPV